ncbi:MAG: hypothetical protein L3J03_10945 [Desulfobacterales bacterium]|nr:hypothetical protein [Desulfobacterales bacterium]
MTLKLNVRTIFFLVVMTLLIMAGTRVAVAVETAADAYRITGVTAVEADGGLILRIQGSAPPTYTVYELFDPLRTVIDIADASFAESVLLPMILPSSVVSAVHGEVIDDRSPPLARLELFLTAEEKYAVERQGNDIVITFPQPVSSGPAAGPASPGEAIVADLTKQEQTVRRQADGADGADVGDKDAFAYSGYNKMGISVDFYKIDLHNVFRLFGEISGMNIVVDEGVGGTLTLALNNVPWDFVLDVILNLKDLQKLERYGTIVIAPKDKKFDWPTRPADNLTVRQQLTVTPGEGAPAATGASQSVLVQKRAEMPAEVLAANKLEREGRALEKAGDLDGALVRYEKALAQWPANGRLAGRLATLYLVHKGMNAKAVHYAKMALQADADDRDGALIAAIGLANMKKIAPAKEYFDLAVREPGPDGTPPASEALFSYAVFSEENGNNVGALLLLARHEELYGDTLETMIAKARIYDKEGNSDKAVAEYRSILLSGFELPPDLLRYINGRVTLEQAGQQIR